jgi:hypothetical protein
MKIEFGNFSFTWKYWGYCKNGKWLFLSPELFYMRLRIIYTNYLIKKNRRKLKYD